ncbi:hypothetical protein PoB_004238300 [Plakobranchus ocellatus]|uniref:Uncharacterized protein n=1 Tax=Plakobranchus ocellatus TaxID=259542 RepID=A0AAV4B8G0_9GAST|nr:hypothetical protein PoB_004238300 [Plakobranchus ocellatus]
MVLINDRPTSFRADSFDLVLVHNILTILLKTTSLLLPVPSLFTGAVGAPSAAYVRAGSGACSVGTLYFGVRSSVTLRTDAFFIHRCSEPNSSAFNLSGVPSPLWRHQDWFGFSI